MSPDRPVCISTARITVPDLSPADPVPDRAVTAEDPAADLAVDVLPAAAGPRAADAPAVSEADAAAVAAEVAAAAVDAEDNRI